MTTAAKQYEAQLIDCLQRALDIEAGRAIEIKVLDRAAGNLVRAKLYSLKKKHPEYRGISLILLPSAVWLLRTKLTYDDPLVD